MLKSIIRSVGNIIIVILFFAFLEWAYADKDRNLAISIAMVFLFGLSEIRDAIEDLKEKLSEQT